MLAILALKQIERKYDYACNCGLKTDIDGKILYFDQYRDLNRKKIFWFIIWDHDRSHNRKRDYQYSITTCWAMSGTYGCCGILEKMAL